MIWQEVRTASPRRKTRKRNVKNSRFETIATEQISMSFRGRKKNERNERRISKLSGKSLENQHKLVRINILGSSIKFPLRNNDLVLCSWNYFGDSNPQYLRLQRIRAVNCNVPTKIIIAVQSTSELKCSAGNHQK